MAKSISSSSTSERGRTVCRQPAISAAICEIRFFCHADVLDPKKVFAMGKWTFLESTNTCASL